MFQGQKNETLWEVFEFYRIKFNSNVSGVLVDEPEKRWNENIYCRIKAKVKMISYLEGIKFYRIRLYSDASGGIVDEKLEKNRKEEVTGRFETKRLELEPPLPLQNSK